MLMVNGMDRQKVIWWCLNIALLPLILAGCGGGGSSGGVTPPVVPPVTGETPGLLVPVSSDSQLLESIRTGFKTKLAANTQPRVLAAASADSESSSGGGSYTTTYTLEASVDEHDYVKYDGTHLYIAPTRSLDCCFILEDDSDSTASADEALVSTTENERSIRILETDPDTAGITVAGSIPLDDDRTIEGLYIDDGQLATINSSGWWGIWGRAFEDFSTWEQQHVGIEIPHYCYHPKLPVAGNCRMCLVHVAMPGRPGPDGKPPTNDDGTPKVFPMQLPYETGTARGVIGCATGIIPGMEIYASSPETRQMREAVLDVHVVDPLRLQPGLLFQIWSRLCP